ncbi:hypothetical protein CLV51_103544 [Chitinophaga niastensis]|uniref:Uncharacterized protein n=1 Tax=Chitinophaga niastensis TaxID=536980 RepID=A0A2P8HK16_CHINA|nr:hypothetical protein [Chitinophaga niastensis]PSL46563.1 hypothetical protein CLV51_103544 [Chitinophaga niastensis]
MFDLIKNWFARNNSGNTDPAKVTSPKGSEKKMDRSDKMQLIRTYLSNGSATFFDDTFRDTNDIVMWIDWGDEEEAMIRYCENVLHTGHLTVTVNDLKDAGLELIIHYKGKAHKLKLSITPEDRDLTLIALNNALQPDFEIRFCIASGGNDTLGFLPLATAEWQALEQEFGAVVAKYFAPLSINAPLFT